MGKWGVGSIFLNKFTDGEEVSVEESSKGASFLVHLCEWLVEEGGECDDLVLVDLEVEPRRPLVIGRSRKRTLESSLDPKTNGQRIFFF